MRWLALVLVLVSIAIYYLPDFVGPSGGMANVASGSLPRVASLKSPGPADSGVGPGAPADESEMSCARLGWIETAERARSLVDSQPLAEEAGFRIEEVERELAPLQWVLIPPQPEAVALSQFRDIQRQGIDSYLVTEGENRNAISLGLFESRESAISVLEEKKRQNLNAVLVNFPRNQISYALDFEPGRDWVSGAGVIPDLWRDNPLDLIEIEGCKGVASAEKNP